MNVLLRFPDMLASDPSRGPDANSGYETCFKSDSIAAAIGNYIAASVISDELLLRQLVSVMTQSNQQTSSLIKKQFCINNSKSTLGLLASVSGSGSLIPVATTVENKVKTNDEESKMSPVDDWHRFKFYDSEDALFKSMADKYTAVPDGLYLMTYRSRRSFCSATSCIDEEGLIEIQPVLNSQSFILRDNLFIHEGYYHKDSTGCVLINGLISDSVTSKTMKDAAYTMALSSYKSDALDSVNKVLKAMRKKPIISFAPVASNRRVITGLSENSLGRKKELTESTLLDVGQLLILTFRK